MRTPVKTPARVPYKHYRVETDLGPYEVWAKSPAQARARAKYKAVHGRFSGYPGEIYALIRDCRTYGCKEIKEDGQI